MQLGDNRTFEQRRAEVRRMLADPEWGQRSTMWIAKELKVSFHLVAKLRTEKPKVVTSKNGRQMAVDKIGRAGEGNRE
jgi:hypothetical protein